jgi:hypothetical protein
MVEGESDMREKKLKEKVTLAFLNSRDGNLPIPSGYPQKIPTMDRVKTRILGTGMGMGNYPQN